MKDNEHEVREPLPEVFASEDEAGEFWDTHSTADYEEYLEPVDAVIDIRQRHFEIEVDRETFIALNTYARKVKMPVKSIASSIIRENIASL
ncbi:MAG: CopG family antitoxin [Thermodesulfobacteriota bacterium]|nr:CopG family antitoxin [Thermodesulfobacteriota bacterium]